MALTCGFVGGSAVYGQKRSSFVVSNCAVTSVRRSQAAPRWSMAKVAKFGPFTPVVVAARVVIGEKQFNRIRGKAIALHSQTITNFCSFVGADGKMRAGLIGLAKQNGNTLGFLS
mmetsp:Transcript_13109/g.40371  ORF Transcript_13109/g.40371 Transcript_13109/m.40371 type:complete len:115 (+) Transcript_13109:169-513(+)